MRKIYNVPIEKVTPETDVIIQAQGVPRWITPDERVVLIAKEAAGIYRSIAKPTGIIMEITKDEFDDIFPGEEKNETDSPVEPIFRQSDDLALFAVTLEEELCTEIRRQFSIGEYALGAMLDAAASEGAEMTAEAIENIYRSRLQSINRLGPGHGVLRFSPGYCGWHVSGQRKLFRALHPEDIGIELNESFLMQPIKSISGVIIAGKKATFDFEDSFSFCADCRTHSCRERIEAVKRK